MAVFGEFGKPNEFCYQKIKNKDHSTKIGMTTDLGVPFTLCSLKEHFDHSANMQRKCITLGGYEKRICSVENQDLRVYMHFTRRTPNFLEHPNMWIVFFSNRSLQLV